VIEESGQEVRRLFDDPGTLCDWLWHIMIHEIRHTAQIVVLLRTQGIRPPSLDLLFYLPGARA